VGAHSTSDDPTRYRSADEVALWTKRDPIDRVRKYLTSEGALTRLADDELQEELTQAIAAAVTAVESMEAPERASLFDDVYAELPWHLTEQREGLASLPSPRHHKGD
jgi:pyruvate dehydrogenase E1 component alpha subunit/2-oxoisovalerate dehydrogenase E1 component alpha subunit